MSALTKDDLNIIEGDALVSDRRLAEALGFEKMFNFCRLIKRHEEEFRDFGGLFLFREEKSGRGRPGKSYLLNEHQAVALAMWANTPQARDARMQIINVFVAWRRGEDYTLAQEAQKPDVFAQAAKRSSDIAAVLHNAQGMNGLVAEVTHLPIWTNGRRPKWWSNLECRAYLTMVHRQVMIKEAVAYCNSTFGEGTTSVSAVRGGPRF